MRACIDEEEDYGAFDAIFNTFKKRRLSSFLSYQCSAIGAVG
jgi:hypothetical protein